MAYHFEWPVRDWMQITDHGLLRVVVTDSLSQAQAEHFALDAGIPIKVSFHKDERHALRKLLHGHADLMAIPSEIYRMRQCKQVRCTYALAYSRHVLVQRNDSTAIQSAMQLHQKTVHIMPHSYARCIVEQVAEFLDIDIHIVESKHLDAGMVSSGQIDYALIDEQQAIVQADSTLDCQLAMSMAEGYGWCVRRQSTRLLQKLNTWILSSKSNGAS